MTCANCPTDLAGERVTVVRTVIVGQAVERVRICVPCDQKILPSDLHWKK